MSLSILSLTRLLVMAKLSECISNQVFVFSLLFRKTTSGRTEREEQRKDGNGCGEISIVIETRKGRVPVHFKIQPFGERGGKGKL